MKKNSLIEYLAYLLVRFLGALITALPLKLNFILGRLVGVFGFFILSKKRRLVIKNLKRVFPDYEYNKLEKIAKKAFVGLALNITEALYIPRINSKYINKHVRIENLKYLDEALSEGKGVILLAYHFGNWELANVTCGLQGYSYKVVVNEQRYPLINNLLNRYRESKGCKTIPRGIALRQILKALKNNEVVAMVGDQGGKEGKLVDFFGVPTPMPIGAVRFALNTGSRVLPVLIMRERGFYHRIVIEERLTIESQGNEEESANKALIQSSGILERYVEKFPQEYFWFYKIWKYSPVKSVVILSDNKIGHLRQSQAVLKIIKNLQPQTIDNVIEVKFKNGLAKTLFRLGFFIGFDFSKIFLVKDSYLSLRSAYADLVISAGASLSAINLILTKENLAKSICIMKPGLVDSKKFNLIIAPKHDNPPKYKNIVLTKGALNIIDSEYLKEQVQGLRSYVNECELKAPIGLFIGGNTPKYKLTLKIIREVVSNLKEACEFLDRDIMITTSRRTPPDIEILLKEEFGSYERCKLLVVANEKNIPEAVGGIIGLSKLIVVSGESISMISEAASAGKQVLVFRLKSHLSYTASRHEIFLENLKQQGYVHITEARNISSSIKDILAHDAPIKKLDDRDTIEEAVKKIL